MRALGERLPLAGERGDRLRVFERADEVREALDAPEAVRPTPELAFVRITFLDHLNPHGASIGRSTLRTSMPYSALPEPMLARSGRLPISRAYAYEVKWD